MLEPEEIKWDQNGQWLHSVVAAEDKEDVPIHDYACAEGMEFSYIGLDEQLWNIDGPTALSEWNPEPPDGAGWFPIAFTEGEEGPFAIFARPGSPKREPLREGVPVPVDLLIFCPSCGKQHVDQPEPLMCKCGHHDSFHFNAGERNVCAGGEPEDGPLDLHAELSCKCSDFEVAWDNPPHKSHTCRLDYGGCGKIFRIADFPTNGVAAIKTRGKDDTWFPEQKEDTQA